MSVSAPSSRARTIYGEALVWDNHACPPRHNADALMHQTLRYRRAGIDVVGLNLGDADVPLEEIVRQAAKIRTFVDSDPEHFVFVRRVADLHDAKASNRTAVLLNIEGSHALDGQPGLIPLLFDIGVRWMAMVYNAQTAVGYGVHDPEDKGLTAFGRDVVRDMDRVGIIKCCSHTGYRTAMDVFEMTDKPTIFSHSNPRALRDHPRNIPDELIKACAATDGCVGVTGVGIFLGDNDTSVETMARHIDYVSELVGPRHVALGLDYVFSRAEMDTSLAGNATIWPPGNDYDRPRIGFAPPEQILELTEALVRRNYADADIKAILGGNLLRVAERVWPP